MRKLNFQFMCTGGDIWSEMHVPMSMSYVLRKKILGKISEGGFWGRFWGFCARRFWGTADVIELDFNVYEMRTVKILVDGLYGCDTEDVNVEDLLKLLALVHAEGSHEERD